MPAAARKSTADFELDLADAPTLEPTELPGHPPPPLCPVCARITSLSLLSTKDMWGLITSPTTSMLDVLLYTSTPYEERTCSRSAEISSTSAPVRMTFMRSSRSDKPSGTRFPVLRLVLNRVWKKDTPSILDMKTSETMTVYCSPLLSLSSAAMPSVSCTTTHRSPNTLRHLLMKKYACTRSSSMYRILKSSCPAVSMKRLSIKSSDEPESVFWLIDPEPSSVKPLRWCPSLLYPKGFAPASSSSKSNTSISSSLINSSAVLPDNPLASRPTKSPS
mmetsp:Transcript_12755/g.51265  ORF Transcript_12755/g.51265 Transcript_12755/m.51265 type:complete len:276 (-) Transcript_12755:1913-2740(-)